MLILEVVLLGFILHFYESMIFEEIIKTKWMIFVATEVFLTGK